MVKLARRIPVSSPDTSRAIDEVRELANTLAAVELLDGRLLEDQALGNGTTTKLNHGMGRALRGYLIVRQDTAGTVHEVSGADATRQLWLQASAAMTVSLWVF